MIKEKAEERETGVDRERRKEGSGLAAKNEVKFCLKMSGQRHRKFLNKNNNQIIHSDGKTIIESERRREEKRKKRETERKDREREEERFILIFVGKYLFFSLCFLLPPSFSIPIIHIFLLSLLTLICPCKMYWEEKEK